MLITKELIEKTFNECVEELEDYNLYFIPKHIVNKVNEISKETNTN